MAEHQRIVGSLLYLNLQLALPDDTKFVRAYLYDESGTIYDTVDLTNATDGLYYDAIEQMPNKDQVKVVYCVFDDALYTIQSAEYARAIDIFDKAVAVPSSNAGAGLGDITGYIDDLEHPHQ